MWCRVDLQISLEFSSNLPSSSPRDPRMKTLTTLLIFAFLICGVNGLNRARAHWLPEAAKEGAVCLDGSAPLYYLRPGSPVNASKWVFHIQGGAWCGSYDDCLQRSQTRLGSSNREFQPCLNDTGDCIVDLEHLEGCNNTRWCGAPMVNDTIVNPLMHDWTAVLIMYCDGGSFTGNNSTQTSYQGHPLFFRGERVLNAIFDDLLNNQGLDRATHVVLGGDSAGGQAVYLHIDALRSRLPASAHVVGVPDSGYFMPLGAYNTGLRWLYTAMNSSGSISSACRAAHTADPAACIFVPVVAPYISTRLFVIQSQFDPSQPMASHDPAYINTYGRNLFASLFSTLLGPKPDNGAFLYSCYQHCGGWEFIANGTTGILAFNRFFTSTIADSPSQSIVEHAVSSKMYNMIRRSGRVFGGRGLVNAALVEENQAGKWIWLQNHTYPCEACCVKG
eukprot:m.234482 g.234482  ORF g.234482 m.234482 type:complete len:447 (+) comp19625_c0_seq1:26-1366(+)